jgi:hypothetical protein
MMGEVFNMLREMIFDAYPVLVYMFYVSLIAGIGFAVGLPHIPPSAYYVWPSPSPPNPPPPPIAPVNCPCISAYPPTMSYDPATGQPLASVVGFSGTFVYPSTYGLHACAQHDLELPPYCAPTSASAAFDPLSIPSWCSSSWCYVNPGQCDVSNAPAYYFTANLSYSYTACAEVNLFASFVNSLNNTNVTGPLIPWTRPVLHAYHPIFAGFWATIGEIDGSFLARCYELASPARNRFNWLPILMWVQTFVCTIFLVNLMSEFAHGVAPCSGWAGPCRMGDS